MFFFPGEFLVLGAHVADLELELHVGVRHRLVHVHGDAARGRGGGGTVGVEDTYTGGQEYIGSKVQCLF